MNPHATSPRAHHALSVTRRARKALTAAAFALLSACLLLTAAYAESMPRSASEEAVKAAFIYRFLNYVEWPPATFASADAPYVIGVAGAEDVADELKDITAKRKVNNRPVVLKPVHADDSLAGIHVLFIGKNEKSHQAAWIKSAQQQGMLIVTETAGALEQGSMINFVLVDQRVRFEVNLAATERARLKINSRILAVAVSVLKETP